MRTPDTKKADIKAMLLFAGRRYYEDDPAFAEMLPPPAEDRKVVVLADVQLDRAARKKLSKALALLDPSPAQREIWHKKVHSVLAIEQTHPSHEDEVDDENGDERRRSRGRPANIKARRQVELARVLLEMCECQLTTERNGRWHLLSQVFADTSRDIRHHLEASRRDSPLAEKS
jgi:hypothetical protein